MIIDSSFLQPSNAFPPIEVTLFGMLTVVSVLHSWNAPQPIVFTFEGMSMVFNLTHPPNAATSIEVTVLGIETESKSVHSKKASSEIFVTFYSSTSCITVAGISIFPKYFRPLGFEITSAAFPFDIKL